jgi:hypothetical protein
LIELEYGVKMKREQLWRIYRENGVTARKPHSVPWRSVNNMPELVRDRYDFCQDLAGLIKSNAPLLYVDQTSQVPPLSANLFV